jgi:hypothetical protein
MLSRRKPTLLGSKKLHQLYKKATANNRNKAIVAAVMSAVLGIAALFISSKGGYLDNWTRMRGVLMEIPGGATVANKLQILLDTILRVLGYGVNVNNVVVPKNANALCLVQGAAQIPDEKCPPKDVSIQDVVSKGGQCQVVKINRDSRTMTLRLWDSKKQSVRKLLTNADVYGRHVKKPSPNLAFEWSIDQWKKAPQSHQPVN